MGIMLVIYANGDLAEYSKGEFNRIVAYGRKVWNSMDEGSVVKMFKKIMVVLLILFCILIVGTPSYAETSQQTVNATRISGQTRFETAKAISEQYNQGKVHSVILSTGNEFADALSASVLAHQKDATILLVDSNVEGSQDALNYITQHLDPTGTVYLIGGIGAIGKEFETKLNTLGFNNLVRIAGSDSWQHL